MTKPSLLIRNATVNDFAAIQSLSAQIWEGDDYIPQLFEKWVADQNGRFQLAFIGNQLAGCNKISLHTDGEWWLEGLRVDPAFRGQHVASALHHEAINWLDQHGKGVVRFASKHRSVAQLAASTGFKDSGSYWAATMETSPKMAGRNPFRQAVKADLARLYDAFAGSFIESNWIWYKTVPQLQQLVEKGDIYWWTIGKAYPVIFLPNKDQSFTLAGFNCPRAYEVELSDALAALSSGGQIKTKLLALPGRLKLWKHAGWSIDEELIHLYTRPLS